MEKGGHDRIDTSPEPAVLLANGARHAEEILLGELRRIAAQTAGHVEPAVRVIVPSHALRGHVSGRIASEGPVLGIRVQTLHSVAAEILERADQPLPLERTLLQVLVAREAGKRPELAAVLAGLDNATRVLEASVRDLLDAGFVAAHREAVLEQLALLKSEAAARARGVVEVASEVSEVLEHLQCGGTALLFRNAAHCLAHAGAQVFPARAVFIHGFADATGTALELLQALVAHLGAQAVVALPADPASLERCPRAELYAQRLRERLAGARGEKPAPAGVMAQPTIRILTAQGLEGEVRAVAAEVADLLQQGVAPERIAVVARQLAPYEAALAVHFERLGVPYSVQGGAGVAGPLRRTVCAFSRLLEQGPETPLDTWLALQPEAEAKPDLRLALRAVGVGTLHQLAALDVDAVLGAEDSLALPFLCGLETAELQGEKKLLARHRRVAKGEIEHAKRRAQALCELLAAPPAGKVCEQLELVRTLGRVCGGLGEGEEELTRVLEGLLAALPDTIELEWAETRLLVRRALEGAGREALGGEGAGVQVLGVTEARGLTFDYLFLLGLNRDVFPRVVSEDPLLPDRLRLALLPLLPDLPLKALGHEEERYLFAYLVGAAQTVTLTWQAADDDGRVRPPSPLLQRLLLAGEGKRLAEVKAQPLPVTLLEHAVEAGLVGDRDGWEAILALHLSASGTAISLANIKRRILDEVDPDIGSMHGRQAASELSPYLGVVGPLEDLEEHLFVTTLEGLAKCPWHTFLCRILRLRPLPDPRQELASLPPALVGTVVHEVLAQIAGGRDGETRWEEVLSRPLRPVAWPEPKALLSLAQTAAAKKSRETDLVFPALALALAQQAQPVLEVARQLEWEGASPPVIGAEVRGWVEVRDMAGRMRRVGFTCDRLDRSPQGAIVGTDYKTGRAKQLPEREAARRKFLLREIVRGEALQAAAYACAPGGCQGRYLYLHPLLGPGAREAVVDRRDEEAVRAFHATLALLLALWDAGLFPPRLAEPDGSTTPSACEECEFVEACVQHDSTARQRLVRWASASSGPERLWWQLPRAEVDEGKDT